VAVVILEVSVVLLQVPPVLQIEVVVVEGAQTELAINLLVAMADLVLLLFVILLLLNVELVVLYHPAAATIITHLMHPVHS
jgi:hypothetical protein